MRKVSSRIRLLFRSALCLPLSLWLGSQAAMPSISAAQSLQTTVRSDVLLKQPDASSAMSVIELGLPGQASAPSASRLSLAELIAGQPGVQVRRAGGLGQFSGASLRGSAPGQVAVFLDGVPLSRSSQSAVDLSLLPLEGLERVEVYRGVPPLALGSETVGGAINLITRQGQGPQSGWASLGSGSFGLRRVSLGYKAPKPKVMLTLGYQSADGDFPYYFNEGLRYDAQQLAELRRKNDDFAQVSADARVQIDRGPQSFFLHGSGLLRRQGVAGIGQPSSLPGQPRQNTGRALIDVGAKLVSPSQRIRVDLDGHALMERTESYDLLSLPPSHTEQFSQQAGLRSLLRVITSPQLDSPTSQILAVAELRYERLTQSDLCPAPRLDCATQNRAQSERLRGAISVGGELALAEKRLLFEPGLHLLLVRSVRQSLGDRGTEEVPTTFSALPSPRAAARLLLRPWLLVRMSCGRFVRLPTFLELFGDGAFFRKSLDLRPESAWLGELGIEAKGQPLPRLITVVSLHAFGRTVDDLIDIVRDGPTLRARNVGQVTAAGIELASAARVAELLSVELNYSFLDTRDRTDQPGRAGNLLPGRPLHSVFLRAELSHFRVRLSYELDYTSALFLDPANVNLRPARTLHAVGLSLGPIWPLRLTLRVELRNLLDTRLVDVTLPLMSRPAAVPLTDFFDHPLPGRALYATLSGRL